jgi:hypothetical protein
MWQEVKPPKKRPKRPRRGPYSLISTNRPAPKGTPQPIPAGGNWPGGRPPGTAGVNTPGDPADPGNPFGNPPQHNFDSGSLLSALAARQAAEEQAARARVGQVMESLKPIYAQTGQELDKNYGTAISAQSAVNDAVANRLGIEGGDAASKLAGRLDLIGAGQSNPELVQQLKDAYTGGSAANYAMDVGDVNRLITRLSEEHQVLSKRPEADRMELEAQAASDIQDIQDKFEAQRADIEAKAEQYSYEDKQAIYEDNQKRAEYIQGVKDKIQERADAAAAKRTQEEEFYATLNDRNKQKALDRKWKREDAAAKYQNQIDLANARYAASRQTAADRQAWEADKMAAQHTLDLETKAAPTYADTHPNAKPKNTPAAKDPYSPANRARATKMAQAAIMNPKGLIKYPAQKNNPGNIDLWMQRQINAQLLAAGIDPNSAAGKSIRRAVMASADGHAVNGQSSGYTYDPNWAKGIKAKVKKKRPH